MSDSEDQRSVPEVIADAVTTVATGLPPQIQRSFWKAVGRVFRAGAEWPAAFLEGKARLTAARATVPIAKYEAAAADIRSEQEARAIINRESAAYAATHFADPALGVRAVEYHAAHIIREQANRESVMQKAVEHIAHDPPPQDSAAGIDDDWLTAFLAEASTRSSDEFRDLFGRILAGEIKVPGSFSVGT